MTGYINDSPIETIDDDLYGIAPFAKSLAKSILGIKNPYGTTMAINGSWGSGKSSAVNLIRSELDKDATASKLVVSDFKCWWYRGEEALALAFLQNLNDVLSNTLKDKVKDMIPNLGRKLLQGGRLVGPAVAVAAGAAAAANPAVALTSASLGFAQHFFSEGDTLEKTFRKLAEVLENEDRRFLIIIDDIDRLDPDEALAIFRLVKSVGQLPNVMYLLIFDRILADKTVAERYPSEGPHFLDKIIQAGFELPPPLQSDLNTAVWRSIEQIAEVQGASDIHLMNIFFDIVVPYMTTPRHVVRFQSAISVTWPAIADEVNLGDFIGLETIRLYEPTLYREIRSRKSELCGVRRDREDLKDDRFQPFLKDIDESRHHIAQKALERLFPRIQSMGYDGNWMQRWDAERLVCIERHFDTYFRLSLSDGALSIQRINELVDRADDIYFIQETFRDAAKTTRKTGSTMVPVFLDELITHADRVGREKVEPLLTALFAIHDEIDLPTDAPADIFEGNTSLRYHWLIRRLTQERFSLEERTELYWQSMQTASLGWLIDFTRSAQGHYRKREDGPKREEDCLITESSVPKFITLALTKIRAAARDGLLLNHPDLLNIMYRWRDFKDGDPDEVKSWTDEVLTDDEAFVIFATAFTGYSLGHSVSFDGLSDRVSTKKVRAQVDENIDILDPKLLRSGLERIQSAQTMDESSLEIVRVFLEAWERRTNGDDI